MKIMKNTKKKRVLVIVHDAGGAEIIGAYIKKYLNKLRFLSYVAGPAATIFTRYNIPFSQIVNNRKIIVKTIKENINVDCALIGTMWHTKMELIALKEAKLHGLKTIVYLDSWVNYRKRFDYPKKDWWKNIPDELWVGDIEAKRLAKKLFPKSLQIKLVPNQYFSEIKNLYLGSSKSDKHHDILFVSNSSDNPATAFSLLSQTILGLSEKPSILIRFHPSDNRKWFNLKSYPFLNISISKEKELARDLARTRIAVGQETTALVVSLLCGLPTICIKKNKIKSILPFKKIHIVSNKFELEKELRKHFRNEK